jgi:xanthine dehydrogenase accessory factor
VVHEWVLLRGGGDLGTGVALRLRRAGFPVLVTEIAQPQVVRRRVAFAEAVFTGSHTVEGVTARRVTNWDEAQAVLAQGEIPVLIDPRAEILAEHPVEILVDARMTKLPPDLSHPAAPLAIGLGPGFVAGENCHAVVETKRGHFMGRVYWTGSAEPNTGVPEAVEKRQSERVLRAPGAGVFEGLANLGSIVETGTLLARVGDQVIVAPFQGLLRGLLATGLPVEPGMKVGDLDPRLDSRLADWASDKAMAVGGGVLEAILAWQSGGKAGV